MHSIVFYIYNMDRVVSSLLLIYQIIISCRNFLSVNRPVGAKQFVFKEFTFSKVGVNNILMLVSYQSDHIMIIALTNITHGRL